MEIRMLGLQELSLALDLVREVFEQDVAPSYREEGIEKFRAYLSVLCAKGSAGKRHRKNVVSKGMRTLHTGACSEPCDYECNSQCGKFLYASGNACC